MSAQNTDESLTYTLPFQLTKTIHRKVYDEISPANPANAQNGKIVLITGGGSGIGASAARVWLQAGAEGVVIAGRRQNILDDTALDLRELATKLGKDTKVLAVPTDLTNITEVEKLYEQVELSFGRVPDVVIANAGIGSPLLPLAEMDANEWWGAMVSDLLIWFSMTADK